MALRPFNLPSRLQLMAPLFKRCSSSAPTRGWSCPYSTQPPQAATLTRSCECWTRSRSQRGRAWPRRLTGRCVKQSYFKKSCCCVGRPHDCFGPPPVTAAWRLRDGSSQHDWGGGCRFVSRWSLHKRAAVWQEVPALHAASVRKDRHDKGLCKLLLWLNIIMRIKLRNI